MPDFTGWGILWPQPLGQLTTSTVAFGGTNTTVANVIPVLRQVTVDRIQVYVGSVTTAGEARFGLQEVGSAGNPNGTWLTYADYTISTAGLHTINVNSYTVNPGNWVAVCADVTYGGTASVTLVTTTIGTSPNATWSYADVWSGTWAKNAYNIYLHGFNSSTYQPILPSLPYGNTITYNSNSTPDEVGVQITLPFDCTITGGWAYVDTDANCNINVYRPDGTKLSFLFTANHRQTTAQRYIIAGVTPFNVSANQQVIVSVEPTTTTNIITYRYSILSGSVDQFLINGGQYIQGVQRTNAGSWSTNATPIIGGVVISSITTGGGGGISRSRVQLGM